MRVDPLLVGCAFAAAIVVVAYFGDRLRACFLALRARLFPSRTRHRPKPCCETCDVLNGRRYAPAERDARLRDIITAPRKGA
jgi:hypothetical protein